MVNVKTRVMLLLFFPFSFFVLHIVRNSAIQPHSFQFKPKSTSFFHVNKPKIAKYRSVHFWMSSRQQFSADCLKSVNSELLPAPISGSRSCSLIVILRFGGLLTDKQLEFDNRQLFCSLVCFLDCSC